MKLTTPSTPEEFAIAAKQLKACRNAGDLATLLRSDLKHLPLLLIADSYQCFKLPKPNGKFRLIEAPNKALKNIQRLLNLHLQSVYNQFLPEASHGFILNAWMLPKKKKRHILSNARVHRGCREMLNIDLKDFFHQITEKRIQQVLEHEPFSLTREVSEWIARIACLHGRLPMGAPTSPVLSNMCMLAFDTATTQWAKTCAIAYTRFADDLTFSSEKTITPEHHAEITKRIQEYGLAINPNKVRYSGRNDQKEVTGLVVKRKVRISNSFLDELDADLTYFAQINTFRMHYESLYAEAVQQRSKILKATRAVIEGKLNFIQFVTGEDSKCTKRYEKKYKAAKKAHVGVYQHGYHYFAAGAL